MRRCSRTGLAIASTFLVSLAVAASGAQAVVVNDQGNLSGVALLPSQRDQQTLAQLNAAGIPTVAESASQCDRWLSPDLSFQQPVPAPLCWHGGAVMHRNETFALTWDPRRSYWQTTRGYVEQFLRDVADGAGTLTSPYAITGQYSDGVSDPARATDPPNPTGLNPLGQARNASLYGGGCIDYGVIGQATCQWGNGSSPQQGRDYPRNPGNQMDGDCSTDPAVLCLTDQAIRAEVSAFVGQTSVTQHEQPAYTPLVVLLTPPGVEVCLDQNRTLCSANGPSTSPITAQFCSYHSQVGGVAYVVQPWTANTGCDEPGIPALGPDPTPQQLALDAGSRLVSPLSQGQLAAIVNPGMNGWFTALGSEINDNGCFPLPRNLDRVAVGSSSQSPYFLQREFNNAGAIESEPNAPACAPSVALAPTFVVPSAVNRGDEVQFDGSPTVSSLIVPNADYFWNFGDGSPAERGPSRVHSYAVAGTYSVNLVVIDRGGNLRTTSQTITVLGPTGQPGTPPNTHPHPGLSVRIQLMPQGLRAMLRFGVAVRVICNQRADGIATVSISRRAARQAHISPGRGGTVVIGRGTVSGIKSGTVQLHVRLSRGIAAKLGRLRHVTLTFRLTLVAAGRVHLAIDVAGRY